MCLRVSHIDVPYWSKHLSGYFIDQRWTCSAFQCIYIWWTVVPNLVTQLYIRSKPCLLHYSAQCCFRAGVSFPTTLSHADHVQTAFVHTHTPTQHVLIAWPPFWLFVFKEQQRNISGLCLLHIWPSFSQMSLSCIALSMLISVLAVPLKLWATDTKIDSYAWTLNANSF